jgi:hypothetical protein
MAQDQRSVEDQLKELILLANHNGLYDAADWVRGRLEDSLRCTGSDGPTEDLCAHST